MANAPKGKLKLFSSPAEHIWGTEAGAVAFPKETLNEVAFIGRSNVGKSSLINALVKRNKLARTSNTPGATRAIHFYQIADAFRLVDLPGYGYAKLSKELAAKIAKMVSFYFSERRSLKVVYVLVDARHGLKESDRDMLFTLAECGLPAKLVLTKADKARKGELLGNLEKINKELPQLQAVVGEVLVTSSEKGEGIDQLRADVLHQCGL